MHEHEKVLYLEIRNFINIIASKSVISLLLLAFLLLMILYIYPHYVDLYILLHVSLFNCTKFKDETDYSGND